MSYPIHEDSLSVYQTGENPDKSLNAYRLLRIARDMKVRDLANKLGVTPAYIYAIEAGDRIPPKKLVEQYARALGVEQATILRFSEKNTPKTYEKFLLEILKEIACREFGGSVEGAPTTIDLGDDDFGAILNCAIRYCLGRRTYMPGLVTSYIRPLLPCLNDKTLDVMERDIAEQGKFGYGHECDYETWANFLKDIRAVLSSRET